MSLSKRGDIYYYDFQKYGERHQGSTGQTSKKKAREVEDKLKTDLALSRHGIKQQQRSPSLKDFLNGAFLTDINQHNKNPRTQKTYKEKVRRLLEWPDWLQTPLDEIKPMIPGYVQSRQHLAPDTIRCELATLRKAVILAADMGLAPRFKIKLPKPSRGRKFVLDGELENAYLEAATYPLKQAATLILDLGLRPLECVSLRKADISEEGLMVWDGKSGSRALPLTKRAVEVIRFLVQLHPDSPWLFPGYRNGGHLSRTSLTNRHIKLRNAHPEWPRDLLLYSGRHTFGTRLAESSGGNVFAIKELLGHQSVKTSEKYVHTHSEELSLAMKRKEALDQILRGDEVPAKVPTATANMLEPKA